MMIHGCFSYYEDNFTPKKRPERKRPNTPSPELVKALQNQLQTVHQAMISLSYDNGDTEKPTDDRDFWRDFQDELKLLIAAPDKRRFKLIQESLNSRQRKETLHIVRAASRLVRAAYCLTVPLGQWSNDPQADVESAAKRFLRESQEHLRHHHTEAGKSNTESSPR